MKKVILTTIILTSSFLLANTGEQIAKQNGCMECHNIMGKKLAPAFMGTAKKNIKWYGDLAKSKIKESIKNGSKGKYRKFANTEMPAYAHLNDQDLDTIADWILSEYSKNKNLYMNQKGNRRGQDTGKQQ